MKAPLRPHNEQDGWVYIRVPRIPRPVPGAVFAVRDGGEVHYDDIGTANRIISSRRVEEAVETADYLKLCVEEGLSVCFDVKHYGPWLVAGKGGAWTSSDSGEWSGTDAVLGTTLREAYWRYKAGAK